MPPPIPQQAELDAGNTIDSRYNKRDCVMGLIKILQNAGVSPTV